MSRDITSAVNAEISKQVVEPVLFVEMSFDSAPVRVWSGRSPLTWDSKTWLGTGELGQVSPIQETSSTEAVGMTFSISGIPSANILVAFEEDYQGRRVTMWLGFLSAGTVVADPTEIFSGRMDVMEISEQGDSSTIKISAESRLADLLKTREWRYTHEDQQIKYPGDMGFEFVNELQDKEVLWGPQ